MTNIEDIRKDLNRRVKDTFSTFKKLTFLFYTKLKKRLINIGTISQTKSVAEAYDNDIQQYPGKALVLPMARITHPVYIENHTIDVNPDKYSKHVTPPYLDHLIFKGHNGSTLFIKDLNERGEDNFLKKKYMAHLTQENIDLARPIVHEIMFTYVTQYWKPSMTALENCNYMINKISHFIHFGEVLADDDPHLKQYSELCKALSHTPSSMEALQVTDAYYEYFVNDKTELDRFIFSAIDRSTSFNTNYVPLVHSWWSTGFIRDDIYVEYIHNIMGLNVQWTVLMCRYLENIDKYKEMNIYKILADISPSLAVVSVRKDKKEERMCPLRKFGKDFQDVHVRQYKFCKNMSQNMFADTACLYEENRNGNIVVAPGTQIMKHRKYQVFGDGYRRCPGEALTYMFLKTLRRVIKIFHVRQERSKIKCKQHLGFNSFDLVYMHFTSRTVLYVPQNLFKF